MIVYLFQVNEIIWKPKMKDATFQVCAFTAQTDELVCSRYGIPSFEDSLRFAWVNRTILKTYPGSLTVTEAFQSSSNSKKKFVLEWIWENPESARQLPVNSRTSV